MTNRVVRTKSQRNLIRERNTKKKRKRKMSKRKRNVSQDRKAAVPVAEAGAGVETINTRRERDPTQDTVKCCDHIVLYFNFEVSC